VHTGEGPRQEGSAEVVGRHWGRVLAGWQSCFTKFATCARLLPPLFHVCASGSILCGRVGRGRELERAAHGTTLSFGYLCPCFSLYLLVSLSLGSCDPGPPPPVSISTAQQRMYVLVFVEVKRGVCGHRGACCTSTTMFSGGQLFMFFGFLFMWESSLSLHV
jgi:hypothetical protein